MADITISGMMQRRDTNANWLSNDPTPYAGEICYDTTKKQIKIGDGTSSWSELPFVGQEPEKVLDVSADYTVLDSDGVEVLLVTTGASTITITLPTAADNEGRTIIAKKVDAGAGSVTVAGEGGETIDGEVSASLAEQHETIGVLSTGTAWIGLDGFKASMVRVEDEFTHSSSSNIQDVLDDLDAAIETNLQDLASHEAEDLNDTTAVHGVLLDTDTTLAADSDTSIPSQKAIKAYVDGSATVAKGTITIEIDETNKAAKSGTYVEVNGSSLEINTDTTITDNGTAWASISNSTIFYVYATTTEFQYSTTAPSWDNDKGGWYNSNDRAVAKGFKDASGNFTNVQYYDSEGKLTAIYSFTDRLFAESLLIPADISDITLSGTAKTEQIIICKDFYVSANTTLECKRLIVTGNLKIDSGVTLTIKAPYYHNGDFNSVYNLVPGTNGGIGVLGGGNGSAADAGGGSLYGSGGRGSTGTGGVRHSAEIVIGGSGGDHDNAGGGGGGAGPCAGGGNSANNGGVGGAFITIIVFGDFENQGTIAVNGENAIDYHGGGGGGGLVLCFALGSFSNGGTIEAKGGTGYNRGGGGGGGHIHFAGRTSSFPTLTVTGGTSTGGGNTGSTGTTETVNLLTDPYAILGGKNGDDYAGLISSWIGGCLL